jgi:hypothetical protein
MGSIVAAVAQQASSMPGVENSVGYLASGTSVQPRTTSEATSMIHTSLGNWTFMLHANGFLVDVQQSGLRGHDKFFSPNWFMPMLHRNFGKQGLTFRTMLSLEPATITNRRYPLLFQTGETAYGLSIIDGQHPHNFVMEVSGKYELALAERSQFFVYGGPVAEAALGPTAFPHRASSSENPLAAIGHHMQDSTHIATNVITLGFVEGPLQFEASTFHGREPNENRWTISTGKPDSFATRVTISPHKSLSAQFSTGRLNNPEALDPSLDTVRSTASIHHDLQFSSGHISSSFIWGRNKDLKNGARRIFNSYNFEMTSQFLRHNWIWTRIENVDRDRTLLPVQAPAGPICLLCGIVGFGISLEDDSGFPPLNHVVLGPNGNPVTVEEEPIGRVQAYTAGYERELPAAWSLPKISTGFGFQVTAYSLPSQLTAVYGNHPATVAVFLRFRPTGNMAAHMKLMHRN